MVLTENQKFSLVVIIALLILWVLYQVFRPKPIVVYLIYADWCGHCTRLKPIWNNMKNELGTEIQFIDINEKDSAAVEKLTSQYQVGVSGFPTIFGNDRYGRIVKYDGFSNGRHNGEYLRQFLHSLQGKIN